MDRKASIISLLTGMGYIVVESDGIILTHLQLDIGTVGHAMSVEEIVMSYVPVEVIVENIVYEINKHIIYEINSHIIGGGNHENH